MTSIEFSTRSYVRSHGHEPRGRGSWAFEFEGREPVWTPSLTYGDAKKWIKSHIRALPEAQGCSFVAVTVLP